MFSLRIFIDPLMQAKFGPEVCWTWRFLLSGIGYAWQQGYSRSEEYDIGYNTHFNKCPKCRIQVVADFDRWSQKENLRLERVKVDDGLPYPAYYRESQIHPVFRMTQRELICQRDFIFDIFWLLTGQEERNWNQDKHGFFHLSDSPFLRDRVFLTALASAITSWFERRLRTIGFPRPLARWPNERAAAACLTHDVDYPEIVRWLEPIRVFKRLGLRGMKGALCILAGTKNHWHFSSWRRLERDFSVRSAFFFAARKGSLLRYLRTIPDPFYDVSSLKFQEVLRSLVDSGNEIGLHASYLSYSDLEMLAHEKAVLERASGCKIAGCRHHYWHLQPDEPESTLLLHEKLLFKYDVSLAHDRYVGWRRPSACPFFPFHKTLRREIMTLQLQTAWMDNQLFGFRHCNSGSSLDILQTLVQTTVDHSGCFVADMHQYVFDDCLYPAWRQTYLQLLCLLAARSDFWIAEPAEVAAHYMSRHTMLLRASHGLREGLP